MKIFTVHDSKAEAHLSPIFMKSIGEATRAFQASCEDTNSNFNKYPTDFTLMLLGDYNEVTAEITTLKTPQIISHASEFVLQKKYSHPLPIQPDLQELSSRN